MEALSTANLDELNENGSCSSSRSAVMTTTEVHRESAVSISKFNRFIVGELARKTGEEGRTITGSLRKQRHAASETHRQYGASLGAASRAQMQRDKQQSDAQREANLQKGLQVRDDVLSQKEEAMRLKDEWVEYGKRLAEKDAEQRRRIRDVCGESSKRVQELVAEAKFEEEEYERELAERREQILRENQAEVQRVREETADAVIDASKQYALDRRRGIATATKEQISLWRASRSRNTQDHLRSARANRADAEATRAHAKKLREQLVQQRQKEVQAAREAMKRNKLSKEQQTLEAGANVKAMHDGMYRSRYVPQESADYLNTSKYGKSTVA
jgi:hypothetical protein